MDPFIFSLIVAWFLVRGSVEDTIYAARGRPSPRQTFRQQYGPSGPAKVAHAAGDRLAQRIANPKGPGPTRRYFSELWIDSMESAVQHRRERAVRREAKRNGDEPPPKQSTWWQWRRPKTEPAPEQPDPVRATAERVEPEPAPQPDRSDIVDAEIVDGPDQAGCWNDLCVATDHGDAPDTHVDTTGYSWTQRPGDEYCPYPDCGEYAAPHTHDDGEAASDEGRSQPPDPTTEGDPATNTEVLSLTDQPDFATENGAPPMSNDNVTIVAAEGSLAAYVQFVQGVMNASTSMVNALETTAASMKSQDYGEAVTGPMAQAQEMAGQIAALMADVTARLEESTTVADSYAAASHTGTKESLLAG